MRAMLSPWIIVGGWLVLGCAAQQSTPPQETCYPPGGVAGIVIATIVVTAVVFGLSTAAAWRYWKIKGSKNRDHTENKQTSHKAPGDFAFDNPYFRDQEGDEADTTEKGKARSSINNKNSLRSSKQSDFNSKTKRTRNGKNHFMFGGGGGKKHRAMDDSCLAVEPERTVVSLRGHDFTGLGFNICGNMRDGILVKDVLHRGPASESGLIKAGDKIISVTVSFTNIVYEDALTILSYASPYDVQLELERIPDKSRAMQTTPSGGKRLGSCSFNNSGQKLFHPLYRSQSIDDLTQIDKDTFPSHGPRRSQSVGVAAHKLATHFKNSDSKLEDRSPASLILSTTGSLNEKMLANVMADGSLHKNGLQWEKRFEDTLESEDSGSHVKTTTDKSSKRNESSSNRAYHSTKDSTSSNGDDTSDADDENTNKTQSYVHKGRDYRDSPRGKGKLEAFRPKSNKNDNTKTVAQVHQLQRSSGRRAKTMADASSALWHLDQSIKDGDSSISDLEHPPWNVNKDGETPRKSKSAKQDGDNASDVSHDSLEFSARRSDNRKVKKCPDAAHSRLNEVSKSNTEINSTNKQKSSKKSHPDGGKNKEQSDSSHSRIAHSQSTERIYDSQDLKSSQYSDSFGSKEQKTENATKITFSDGKRRLDLHEKSDSMMQHDRSYQPTHSGEPHSNYSKVNGRNTYSERQDMNSSDNYSSGYGSGNRFVNGESDEYKSRFLQNSKCGYPQKNQPLSYQKQMQQSTMKCESDLRTADSKSNLNQKYSKKSSNPAGTFTQINPFQQQSKQKTSFKPWVGRDDINKEINSNEPSYSPSLVNSNRITTCDSSNQRMRRDNGIDSQYSQRSGDSGVSRTVLISAYESSAGRTPVSVQSNHQKLGYR